MRPSLARQRKKVHFVSRIGSAPEMRFPVGQPSNGIVRLKGMRLRVLRCGVGWGKRRYSFELGATSLDCYISKFG